MLNNEKEWSFDCNIYTFAKILLIFTRESNNFFICNKVLHSEKVRKKMSGPGWLRQLEVKIWNSSEFHQDRL